MRTHVFLIVLFTFGCASAPDQPAGGGSEAAAKPTAQPSEGAYRTGSRLPLRSSVGSQSGSSINREAYDDELRGRPAPCNGGVACK